MSHNINHKDPIEALIDSAPLPQFPCVPRTVAAELAAPEAPTAAQAPEVAAGVDEPTDISEVRRRFEDDAKNMGYNLTRSAKDFDEYAFPVARAAWRAWMTFAFQP